MSSVKYVDSRLDFLLFVSLSSKNRNVSHKVSDEAAVSLMISKKPKPLEAYPGRVTPVKKIT